MKRLSRNSIITELQRCVTRHNIITDQNNIDNLKRSWSSIESEFFKMFKIFFDIKDNNFHVKMFLSAYGTKCSFYPNRSNYMINFYIWLRDDAQISNIGEAILTSYFQKDFESCVLMWSESESCVDFILMSSAFKKLLPNFQPTILNL